MLSLVPIDFIHYPKKYNKSAMIYSDATPDQIGAYVNNYPFHAKIKSSNIMIAETLAAILAILQTNEFSEITINVDNMATLSYLRKGAAKFLNTLSIQEHYIFLLARLHIDNFFNINPLYIKSENNPADYLSRI